MNRHARTITAISALGALALLAGQPAAAQQTSRAYVPLDDVAYSYIDALMARGGLRALASLERPYTVAELDSALDADSAGGRVVRGWRASARAAAAKYAPAPDTGFAMRASLYAGATAQTSGRRELMLADDRNALAPMIGGRVVGGVGAFAFAARAIGDRRLRSDPEYTGKVDSHAAGRVEDGYVVGDWRYAGIFFGRLARNWGPPTVQGLQLGHYAYSYDHLAARLGPRDLHLASLFARLDDDVEGDTTYQRYVAMHRLAGRWRAFEVGASEAVVYGGVARGIEPALVNPLNVYSISQYDEGQKGNISYAFDAAWRPARGPTIAAQLLVDDFQVDHCVPNCQEPPSYGATLTAEGLPLPGDQRAFASYTRVSNLTYRTPSTFERFAYLGVGLGHGFSDYDEARAGLDLAIVPQATTRLYVAYRRQGEGDYRLPFPVPLAYAATPAFLSGTVLDVLRIAASGAATAWDRAELSYDVGVNHQRNAGHVVGASRTDLEARVRLTIELAAFGLRPR